MPIHFGTDGWRAVMSDNFTFANLCMRAQAIALMAIAFLFMGCSNQGQPNLATQSQAATEIIQALPSETHAALPSLSLTENSSSPSGKLLNPCALMPADQVETSFGVVIKGDWRRSFMLPTTDQSSAQDFIPEKERILYDCRYWTSENVQISMNVEIFDNPEAALAQMEVSHVFYDQRLQSEGLHPMVEINGLGDKAFSFVSNPSEGVPSSYYPIIYFSYANYLVTINIFPPPQTVGKNNEYFDQALELAGGALAGLPEDSSSMLPDQDYHLDEPWQPAGKPFEPCELISREEAHGYIDGPITFETSVSYWGLAYGGAEGLHPSLTTSCAYRSPQRVGTLQGLPVMEGVEFAIDQISEGDKELFISRSQSRNLAEVSGLGEMAFRDPATGNDMVVLQGNMIISVQISNSNDSNSQFQSAFEIAQLILSRLK